MEVDDSSAKRPHSCPRDFVKQMSLVMDEHGAQTHPRHSATRASTKSKAPSPPGLNKLNSPGLSQWYPGNPALTMDQKENLIDKELSLLVVLPGGMEKMTTVHGSKPLMDLLVMLCAKYHLNPSSHTLELVTTNRNNIKLKPNALIGSLDAEKIILKPKGEDKNKKTGPQMPEATVRMVINYRQTQKTILRVNPRVPLTELLPAICEKCEFEVESTILLKDVKSLAPLDLSASLNDYAIREVYARDTSAPASPVCPASPPYTGSVTPGKDKNQKEKENKGLFSMFRRSKKTKPEQATTASAPASPVLVSKPRPLSMALPSTNSSLFGSPSDVSKKRRAPQPPILVSQMSCPADLSPRHRLCSEPSIRLDSTDQGTGLSRGSSAESSLKRTKRKAPPPPASPGIVAPEASSPIDFQASAPANTLEEIKEQEETNSSAMSTASSAAQGEDTSLNASPDVTLQSPSPDTLMESTMSVEQSKEDQTRDVSSDGNQRQSALNDSANVAEVEKLHGADSTETTHTSQSSTSKESTTRSVQVDSSTLPSPARLVQSQPVMQDAEAQASPHLDTESPGEQTDIADGQQSLGTSHTTGEDAQVQTDFIPLPVPPEQQPDNAPSSPNKATESGKKDMATLTDDLNLQDVKPTLTQTSKMQSHDLAPSPSKVPSPQAAEAEPKPKPSNELTRDYIPKVGMTTYTIVPQKSLEKLRYFEVALTLEAPPPTSQEGLNISSLQLEESSTPQGQTVEKSKKSHSVAREDLAVSKSTTTITNQGTANGSIQETATPATKGNMSTTTTGVSQAGSPTEVKEIKIPPATKPKPGSFRLPQHKKTPGYYVTSAAEKSLSAGSGSSQRQAEGNTERAVLPPPPLSPTAQCPEHTAEGASVSPSPKGNNRDAAIKRMKRQSSLPAKEPSSGLSLEKFRSFAAPKPYSPSTPSRFAQAVSSAVKRSQPLSPAPLSPRSPSFSPSRSPSLSPSLSPFTSRSPVLESKEVAKDNENDVHTEEGSTMQHIRHEAALFSGIVEVEGEGNL